MNTKVRCKFLFTWISLFSFYFLIILTFLTGVRHSQANPPPFNSATVRVELTDKRSEGNLVVDTLRVTVETNSTDMSYLTCAVPNSNLAEIIARNPDYVIDVDREGRIKFDGRSDGGETVPAGSSAVFKWVTDNLGDPRAGVQPGETQCTAKGDRDVVDEVVEEGRENPACLSSRAMTQILEPRGDVRICISIPNGCAPTLDVGIQCSSSLLGDAFDITGSSEGENNLDTLGLNYTFSLNQPDPKTVESLWSVLAVPFMSDPFACVRLNFTETGFGTESTLHTKCEFTAPNAAPYTEIRETPLTPRSDCLSSRAMVQVLMDGGIVRYCVEFPNSCADPLDETVECSSMLTGDGVSLISFAAGPQTLDTLGLSFNSSLFQITPGDPVQAFWQVFAVPPGPTVPSPLACVDLGVAETGLGGTSSLTTQCTFSAPGAQPFTETRVETFQ